MQYEKKAGHHVGAKYANNTANTSNKNGIPYTRTPLYIISSIISSYKKMSPLGHIFERCGESC